MPAFNATHWTPNHRRPPTYNGPRGLAPPVDPPTLSAPAPALSSITKLSDATCAERRRIDRAFGLDCTIRTRQCLGRDHRIQHPQMYRLCSGTSCLETSCEPYWNYTAHLHQPSTQNIWTTGYETHYAPTPPHDDSCNNSSKQTPSSSCTATTTYIGGSLSHCARLLTITSYTWTR